MKYGWIPDIPDNRDLTYKAKRYKAIPPKIDLRETGFVSPICDQKNLGSCVGNATAKVLEFIMRKQKEKEHILSRLFIYYLGRLIEGTQKTDSGMYIRDAIKVVNTYGTCEETIWPYEVKKYAVQPSRKAFQDALTHQALQYERLPRSHNAFGSRLYEGFPIIIGISVYDSFESDKTAKTGVIPVPEKTETLLGGHCIYILGRDLNKKLYLCANSWSQSWGQKGFFWLPFEFIENDGLSDDFWTITLVE